MAWQDQATSGRGLVKLNLKNEVDWDKLWKSVKNNGNLPLVNAAGTQVMVDCSMKGQKDEGNMTDGQGYRFDIQSVDNGYVNWQIQTGKSSYAGVLLKCSVWYNFDDLKTQLIDSSKRQVLRKDV